MFKSKKSGVSIIEFLVVIAIGAVILSVVMFSLTSLKNTNLLKKNVTEVKSFIDEARSLSISGKNDKIFGVWLQSNKIIMFAGTTSSQYRVLNFDANTTIIDNISLNGGGSVILFNKITGATNNYGSFRVKLVSNNNSSSTITISSTGIVGQQ